MVVTNDWSATVPVARCSSRSALSQASTLALQSNLGSADPFNLRSEANAGDPVADVATVDDIRDVWQAADLKTAHKRAQRLLNQGFHFGKRERVFVVQPGRLSDPNHHVAFQLKRLQEQSAVAIMPGLITPNHQRGRLAQSFQ